MNTKDLEQLTTSWGRTWLGPAAQFLTGPPSDLSSEARRHVADQFRVAARADNGARARDWLVVGIALTRGDSLNDPRLTDALRPSIYRSAELRKVRWAVSRAVSWAAQSFPAVVTTLKSLESYTRLFERVFQDQGRVSAALRQEPSLLLMAIALAEEKFQLDGNSAGWSIQPSQLQSLSKEDVAAAVSYLISSYVDAGLPFDTRLMAIPPSWRGLLDRCGNLILSAHAVKQVLDAETRVYRFGYTLSDEDGVWVLAPPSRSFGMALSHGFLSTVMQMQARQSSPGMTIHAAQSFYEYCEEAVLRIPDIAGIPLVRTSPDPPPRLQIVMRDDVARILSDTVLRTELLFREEFAYLADCCHELFADGRDLLGLDLAPHFTAHDLLRTVRLLRFYAWLRLRGLSDLRNEESADTYCRSLLGGWPDLAGFLRGHGVPDDHISALIALMSYDPGGGGLVDLQYTPILRCAGEAVMLSAILLNSHTLRNAMVRSRNRVDSDGTRERLVSDLMQSLQTRFAAVRSHLRYSGGEIDVLACGDGVLFAFECKNTLLPASAAEQRTMFDHIATGCDQLTRFQHAWEAAEFRQSLARRTGWPLGDAKCVTCLVLSVRLLSGIHMRGHPIRGAHELTTFIESGRIIWHVADEVETFDGYRGRGFSPKTLQEYLSKESVRFRLLWEATEESWTSVESSGWRLVEPAYGLDIAAHRDKVRQEFPLLKHVS